MTLEALSDVGQGTVDSPRWEERLQRLLEPLQDVEMWPK